MDGNGRWTGAKIGICGVEKVQASSELGENGLPHHCGSVTDMQVVYRGGSRVRRSRFVQSVIDSVREGEGEDEGDVGRRVEE